MHITRIDLAGHHDAFALICRPPGARKLNVTVLSPEYPMGQTYQLEGDNVSQLVGFARKLQLMLDGTDAPKDGAARYLDALQLIAR